MKADSLFYPRTLNVLGESDLFGKLDRTVLEKMLSFFQRETWPKKSIVMEPEQTVQKFYILIAGRVKVTRVNPATAREFTLALLGPGDGFDVVSLLDCKKHDVEVVALDPFEAISAPCCVVHDWIEKQPDFNRAFLPYIGKQLRVLANLASDLALHDTGTRLVKLFLQHAVPDDPSPRLKLIHDLSHEELAGMVGSVRAVVNRYLQRLKDEGVILVQRGNIELKNMHSLVRKIEHHLGLDIK